MLRSIFIILLLGFSGTLFSQLKVGVYVSNDNTKFSGDKPQGIDYRLGSGFIVGVKGKWEVTEDIWISLEPSYIFGKAVIVETDENVDSIKYNHNVTNRLFAIPLRVNAYITNRFFASAGTEFAFFTRSDLERFGETIDLKQEYAGLNLSLSFGLGYSIPIKKCQLDIELTYVQTLNNLSRMPVQDSFVPRIRLTSTRPSITFLIPIGSKDE